jgi:hypothetical protein
MTKLKVSETTKVGLQTHKQENSAQLWGNLPKKWEIKQDINTATSVWDYNFFMAVKVYS